eukprot:GHUV01018716.1.p1 GENE.GHUV01018716.1~~GHUV01018716.1.p1  ORF type:complete len:371 (+),score=129.58 GHUV01018716.1:159-1271(+)
MAGIWRAVAAFSSFAADVQYVASLQQLARCSSQLLHTLYLAQQCRSVSSSTVLTAEANTAAATSSSIVPNHDLAVQSGLQQQTGSQALLSTLITQETSGQLGPAHIGLYYNFDKSKVPEAFQPYHQAFYSPRPAKLQRRAGCRGLQAEFSSTHSSSLMWRRSTQELAQVLDSAAVPQVHLKGPAGSGKSIAVVQLVEWARSNGWLALYVPSAVDLTRGGFFYKRPDGTYDTIISAQHILKSMSDSHDKQLAGMKLQLQESRDLLGSFAGAAKGRKETLLDLVNTGLSTDDNGQVAVECCLQLIHELSAASADTPVVLAVDDHNALYWRTDYGTAVHKTPRGKPAYQYRKEVKVNKLNLVSDTNGSCHDAL